MDALARILNKKIKNRNVEIHWTSRFRVRKTILADYTRIGSNVSLVGSDIGCATYIVGPAIASHTRIGKFCSVGSDFMVARGKHPIDQYVSTHPAFYSTKGQSGLVFSDDDLFDELPMASSSFQVEIGHDVWIGARVVVLGGLSIGTGSVIAAGSVVTNDVPPYEVWGGIPAKKIRDRFDESVRNGLLSSEWWNWDIDVIRERSNEMLDAVRFAKLYGANALETSDEYQND